MKQSTFLLVFMFSVFLPSMAQDLSLSAEQEAAYSRTIHQRAEKIVSVLGIPDSSKTNRVTSIIADQYRSLNNIHNLRDSKIKAARLQSANNKEVLNSQVKSFEDEANASLEKVHTQYLEALSEELNAKQIEQVKDGM